MKGQAEIIGIAVVAVLMVGLIIMSMPRAETGAVQEDRETAALVSLLRASAVCEGAKMRVSDLARGCVREDCSCRDSQIGIILEGILAERDYDFGILKDGEEVFRAGTGSCAQRSVWLPGEESVEVRLGTC